MKSFEL